MKAVYVDRPGGSEVLEIRDVIEPSLEPGHLRIEVRAAALNRVDLLQRRGLYPPPPGASNILGLECAGVVIECDGVTEFAKGDRVMALLDSGGYAERVVVPMGQCMKIPPRLTFEQAAAIPEAFLTAHEALFTLGRLQAGNWVLIHAAASGVGSAAVQLARLVGARIIATVGTDEKASAVERLGADVIVDRRHGDFARSCIEHTQGAGVEVLVDFVGTPYVESNLRSLSTGGRWIVVGLLGGASATLDLGQVLRRRLQILGLVMRTRSIVDKCAIVRTFADRFLDHFDRGELAPIVDRIYPLADVRAAHERMETNANIGKIVLRLSR